MRDKTKTLGSDQVRHTPGTQKKARSLKFRIKKKRNCTIRVAKTKALISSAITTKLICVFVFVYADCCFSCAAAHIANNT